MRIFPILSDGIVAYCVNITTNPVCRIIWITLASLLLCLKGTTQSIEFLNPSMEGITGIEKVPDSWQRVSKTPDLLPGYFGIYLPASSGNSYVGLQSSSAWVEAIGQKLSGELKKGKYYSISFDLAFTPVYGKQHEDYGSMVIYGGNALTDTAELLWKSEKFYNTEWKKTTAVFKPSGNYRYISFWANVDNPIDKSRVVVLLDNLSPSIMEGLHIELNSFATCKDINTGKIMSNVSGLSGSYKYLWTPGNDTSKQITNLSAGTYKLMITSVEGLTDSAATTISVSDLDMKVNIISSGCYGDDRNEIIAEGSGGVSPYLYYLNQDVNGRSSPVFSNLLAGNYSLIIRDNEGCTSAKKNIIVTETDPISLRKAQVSNVSCSDVMNGKISLSVTGGAPPYTYSISGHTPQSDSIFHQLDEGQYHYRITDSHDCSFEGNASISKVWRGCSVFIPNAFSPNRDGINDLFRAKVNDEVSSFRMAIYGRWGQLIYETYDPERGWDGKQKGIDLPTGSYLYVITFTDSKAQPRKEQGTFLLIR